MRGVLLGLVLLVAVVCLFKIPKAEGFQEVPGPAPAAEAPAPASETVPVPSNTVPSLAPAPVTYLSEYDLRREMDQTNAIKAINSDITDFKKATTERLDTADGYLRDVVRNVADMSIKQNATQASINGLQVAVPQYQALTEPGWVSMPGIIRPPGSTSERPTYPAASSVNPNDIEAYFQDLTNNKGFSGP
jgi:hypothetical protein